MLKNIIFFSFLRQFHILTPIVFGCNNILIEINFCWFFLWHILIESRTNCVQYRSPLHIASLKHIHATETSNTTQFHAGHLPERTIFSASRRKITLHKLTRQLLKKAFYWIKVVSWIFLFPSNNVHPPLQGCSLRSMIPLASLYIWTHLIILSSRAYYITGHLLNHRRLGVRCLGVRATRTLTY